MSKRKDIMLCYPFEERRLLEPKFGWRWPVIVQPKLDGERCRVVKSPLGVILLSSECNEFVSVPHINRHLKAVARRNSYVELDGELYVHGWDFSEIHSVVSRRENIHERSELMQLHIFDFVSPLHQIARTTMLTYYRGFEEGPIKLVPSSIANSMEEIMSTYDRFINLGYEGIVVRHINAPYVRKRSRFMMKFKPKKEDYYRIVNVLEAVDKRGIHLDMVGAFQCAGSDGTLFNIGAGRLNHDRRRSLWSDWHELLDKFCHVQYQSINPSGAPRFGLCIDISDDNPEEASGGGIL